MKITELEAQFVSQSEQFTALVLNQLKLTAIEKVQEFTSQVPRLIDPIVIPDLMKVTEETKSLVRAAYNSRIGVAHICILNPPAEGKVPHPLFDLANQLSDVLPLRNPLAHPLELHPEVLRRIGKADGTVKVQDIRKPLETGYREQGETSDAFEMHQDGLGSGGTVETVFLYCDSGPRWGGFTYFQNIAELSLELASKDEEAFRALFLPDAVTMLRPRGKGALKVMSPVLYINEAGRPQSCFRKPTGEYVVEWRADLAPLVRANEYLTSRTTEFTPGSTFIHMTSPGECCVIRNEVVAHGRTRYLDPKSSKGRCLSRKWFMRRAEDGKYKHVPGTVIAEPYASLLPGQFGQQAVQGEWLYNSSTDSNELKKPAN